MRFDHQVVLIIKWCVPEGYVHTALWVRHLFQKLCIFAMLVITALQA